MKYIASLSYGKDSIKMLDIIVKNNLPLDEIITCDVWATKTITADLPPMVEFKKYADKEIYKRYGFKVNHIRSEYSYEDYFYMKRGSRAKIENQGKMYGFPLQRGNWCTTRLKTNVLNKYIGNDIAYIGYAVEEIKRINNNRKNEIYPLVDFNITEKTAYDWCKQNDLLSPVYENSNRNGCWFCHNQKINELKYLRKNYPEYWQLMLKWDNDSPVTFKTDGTTLHNYDFLFKYEQMELGGII